MLTRSHTSEGHHTFCSSPLLKALGKEEKKKRYKYNFIHIKSNKAQAQYGLVFGQNICNFCHIYIIPPPLLNLNLILFTGWNWLSLNCNTVSRIALIISNIRQRWFLVTDVKNGAGLTRLKAASGVLLETPKPPCDFDLSCRFFQPAKKSASASALYTS